MSGMGEIFDLAVVIEAIDKFSGPMRAMESSMSSAENRMKALTKTMKSMGSSSSEIKQMQRDLQGLRIEDNFGQMANDLERIGRSSTEIEALRQEYTRLAQQQERVNQLHSNMMKWGKVALTGGAITGAGVMGVEGLVKALDVAGEFQTKMTVIKDITGASTKQMNDLGNSVMNVSTKVSHFNDMTVAGFAQQLASGGFNNTKQVQQLLLPVSQFAEAQFYEGKQSDPTEAVKQAIEMAHVFKNYDPKSFSNYLNTFNKYSNMQPGDSSSLYNTLNYLAPTAFREFKMNSNDVMSLAAIANRIGLTGTHGGTNSADMIMRLIPGLIGGKPIAQYSGTGKNRHFTGYKTPQAWAAMEQLGLVDANGNSPFFKNGHITSANAMLSTLINASKKLTPEQMVSDYKAIFGITGGKAAALMSDKTTLEQLEKMQGQLGKTKSMQQIQEDIRKTPQGQLDSLKSNSMTALLRFAQTLGPMLNPILVRLNSMLAAFLKIEQQHPGMMKFVGVFAVMATGLLLVAGPLTSAIGLIMMMKNGIMLLVESGKIATAMTKIWTGVQLAWDAVMDANPISLIIVAIAALIVVVVLMISHWKQVIIVVQQVWQWMKNMGQDIAKIFTGLWHDAASWGSNIIKGLWQGISSFGGWLGSQIQGFVSKNITGPFKHILGIHSPSTVFAQHGMYIVQGLVQGIDGNSGLAQRSSSNLAKATMTGFGRGSASSGGVGGSPIQINVYASPNQNEEEIANQVIRKLGQQSRRQLMSSGSRLNIQAMR